MFIYAKDCNENVWKFTGPFSFCTYFGFQNDRHLDSKMPSHLCKLRTFKKKITAP